MSKRSFLFGSLALLAALACATPSRASSIIQTTVSFTAASPALSTITITYTVPAGDSLSGISPTTIPGFPLSTVTFDPGTDKATLTFMGSGAATLAPFTFSLTDSGPNGAMVTGTATFSPPGSSLTGFSLKISSVPEPASIALLGIGMTGFLAFRRFFKKPAIA